MIRWRLITCGSNWKLMTCHYFVTIIYHYYEDLRLLINAKNIMERFAFLNFLKIYTSSNFLVIEKTTRLGKYSMQ